MGTDGGRIVYRAWRVMPAGALRVMSAGVLPVMPAGVLPVMLAGRLPHASEDAGVPEVGLCG
jgi:hypothetical protein